ncbi:MAG TPA: hypothetical protein PKA95_08485 [Thermomicrobiales bacterium]|nr:hypothetical protein [Thermomicrobiales bacterium]
MTIADYHAAVAREMSEKDLSQLIVDQARALGWLVYRTWNSQHSPAGFPDLVLVRGDVLIVAELKREIGYEVSPAQERWLSALAAVARAYVWHPRHWLSGEIEAVLRGDV